MALGKSFIFLLAILPLHDGSRTIQSSVIALINEFYAHQSTLHLIAQLNDSSIADLLWDISSYCTNLTLVIESIDNIAREEIEVARKRRNVMIFETTPKSIATFFTSISSTNFAYDGFYTIVIQQISDDDAEHLFCSLWQKFIYNVNILTTRGDNAALKTFFPYRESSCHETNPITINEFHREMQQWSEKDFFPYKFKDFHNCSIRAGTFEYAPAVIKEKHAGTLSLFGSDMKLIRGLQGILNFHLNLTYSEVPGASGMTFDNGTVTGLKVSLLANEFDLLFGLYYATYPNCKYMGCSIPYYAVSIVIIVPQRSLTSLQKFFVPFQLGLWFSLALLIFIALFVIAIVEYKVKSVRNFIIGANIQSPYVEMMTAFIGNSSAHLPKRNFARYLLMTFILFSLVMRTVYTAGLFKFLQSDTKITPIETLRDLVASKYKIYAMFYFETYLRNMGLGPRYVINHFASLNKFKVNIK
jgi:hypothetical protein